MLCGEWETGPPPQGAPRGTVLEPDGLCSVGTFRQNDSPIRAEEFTLGSEIAAAWEPVSQALKSTLREPLLSLSAPPSISSR